MALHSAQGTLSHHLCAICPTANCSLQQQFQGLEVHTFPLQAASTFQPRWDLVEADDWAKRQHLLQRFVQAGRRVICRLRASRRVARIMALAQGDIRDPTQVRELPSIQTAQQRGAVDSMQGVWLF